MKRGRLVLYLLLVLLGLIVVLASRAATPTLTTPTHPSPERQMRAAWQKAQQIGAYHYNASILQTTRPLPRLENVGLSSVQQRIFIDGEVNLPAEKIQINLWSEGGNVLTQQDALQIKVESGRAVGRMG